MKTLRCRDVGFDCATVMRAETEDEVLRQLADHAKIVHNVSEISEQAFAKISKALHDEQPERTASLPAA